MNVSALVFNLPLLRVITMPLIGTSLILYLLIKTQIQKCFHQLIFAGLVLSLASDIQILFISTAGFYFLMAIIATLLSYVFYGLAFFIDFRENISQTKRLGNFLFIILTGISISFYVTAKDNLKEFSIPVILFSVATTAMIVLSAYRYKRVNRLSFKMILTGGVAFLISDLSSGYYYFIEAKGIMLFFYITAYLIAQYLVVIGAIEKKFVDTRQSP